MTNHVARILKEKQQTQFVDKYSGGTFTVAEIATLVGEMLHTDTKETINTFCERFEKQLDTPPPSA